MLSECRQIYFLVCIQACLFLYAYYAHLFRTPVTQENFLQSNYTQFKENENPALWVLRAGAQKKQAVVIKNNYSIYLKDTNKEEDYCQHITLKSNRTTTTTTKASINYLKTTEMV